MGLYEFDPDFNQDEYDLDAAIPPPFSSKSNAITSSPEGNPGANKELLLLV